MHHEFVEKAAKKWWEKRNPGACDIKHLYLFFTEKEIILTFELKIEMGRGAEASLAEP